MVIIINVNKLAGGGKGISLVAWLSEEEIPRNKENEERRRNGGNGVEPAWLKAKPLPACRLLRSDNRKC